MGKEDKSRTEGIINCEGAKVEMIRSNYAWGKNVKVSIGI